MLAASFWCLDSFLRIGWRTYPASECFSFTSECLYEIRWYRQGYILLRQAFSSNFLFSPVMMAWPMYQINIILYARLHLYTAAASIKAWKKSNAKTWRCERCAFATMRSIVGPSLLNQMVAFFSFCSIYVTFVSFSIYLLYVCHTHFHPTLALSLCVLA